MNIEDGSFRYLYAQVYKALPDRCKFVYAKDDLVKLKDLVNKTDVIESCTREKINSD